MKEHAKFSTQRRRLKEKWGSIFVVKLYSNALQKLNRTFGLCESSHAQDQPEAIEKQIRPNLTSPNWPKWKITHAGAKIQDQLLLLNGLIRFGGGAIIRQVFLVQLIP